MRLFTKYLDFPYDELCNVLVVVMFLKNNIKIVLGPV